LSKLSTRVAVYAGTFDPWTNGHSDITERALRVFDRVTVAVAETSAKQLLFSGAERKSLIEGALARFGERVRVELFQGLLVDYVRRSGCGIIIRGLRAVSDYEYEAQMAIVNRQLAEDIETVFFMTSRRVSFISSSIVREIARNGGDVTAMVPDNITKRLSEIYSDDSKKL
jgi:pantetheine-phosphate adenylyltransferase